MPHMKVVIQRVHQLVQPYSELRPQMPTMTDLSTLYQKVVTQQPPEPCSRLELKQVSTLGKQNGNAVLLSVIFKSLKFYFNKSEGAV